MEKKLILIISLFFLLFLIGIGLYLTQIEKAKGVGSNTNEIKNKKLTEEQKELLKRYELAQKEEYSFIKQQEINGRYDEIIGMKNKEEMGVKIKGQLYQLSAYENEDNSEKIICINLLNKKEKCGAIDEHIGEKYKEKALQIFEQLKNEIFIYPEKEEKKIIEFFINEEVLKFKKNITIENIDNKSCKKFEYVLDYKKIPIEKIEKMKSEGIDLAKIGIGYIDNVEILECYDYSSNIVLYKNMSYLDVFGTRHNYSFRLKELTDKVVQRPATNATIEEVLELIEKSIMMEEELNECLERTTNKKACFFDSAIKYSSPEICQIAKKIENGTVDCYYQYAIRTSSPQYCENATGKEDECYIDYVYLNKQKKERYYCQKITNDTLRQECFKILGNDEKAE